MTISIYMYQDYRPYLEDYCEQSEERGIKGLLAKAMDVSSSFFSLILKNQGNISFSQALLLTKFLKFYDHETRYFFLLVQKEQAGTQELKNFFQKEIDSFRSNKLLFHGRFGPNQELNNDEMLSIYCSHWHYSMVLHLLQCKEFRSVEAISKKLRISANNVQLVLDELELWKFIQKKDGFYQAHDVFFTINSSSNFSTLRAITWTVEGLRMLDHAHPLNLHHAHIYPLTKKNAEKIAEIFNKAHEEMQDVARKQTEIPDDVYCILSNIFSYPSN